MEMNEGEALREWVSKRFKTVKAFAEKTGVYPNTAKYWFSCEMIPDDRRWQLKQLGFPIEADPPVTVGDGVALKRYMKANGITNKALAEKMGFAPQNLTNMFSRERLSLDVREKLYKSGIEIFKPGTHSNAVVTDLPHYRARVVHAQAYAGYLQGFNDMNYLDTLPEQIIYVDEPGNYRTFEVKGDSMEPEFPDGCLVDAKHLEPQHWKKLLPGRVFVILHPERGLMVKLLVAQYQDKITLRSINDFYDDFSVSLAECLEVWYFVQKHDTNRDYSRYLNR